MPRKRKELPVEFWTQPVVCLGSEALQLIYAEVSDRLRHENPDADTLEQMLIERIAFLYVYIRNKEAQEKFAHDRAYKEMMQQWLSMATDLRKRREHTGDVEAITDRILAQVQLAVDTAMKELDPVTAREFQDKLINALDQAGL